MAELGAGNGTDYPGTLDTDNILEVNSPNAGKTRARAETINDANAALVAIETELGTDPAGSLTDVKTFLQTEHGADGTHDDNIVNAKSIVDQGSGGDNILTRIVEIGDWNMDTGTQVTVAHGIGASYKNIRSISVIIRDDDDSDYYKLERVALDGVIQGGVSLIQTVNISLDRLTGGIFDAALFDSTSFNRGWVTIQYTE